MQNKTHWTTPKYGFFGKFYQKGDNSKNGYLSHPSQTQKQRTEEEVAGIIRLLGLQPLFSVLDCPCGTGRHSIELAKMGFSKVLAVDSNLEQLSVGMEYSHQMLIDSPTFRLGNMLYIKSGFHFEAVINMFLSFGFFDTDQENKKVAKNFFDLLKPGGKFLMHTDVNMARIRNGTYKFNEERMLATEESLQIVEHYDSRTKRINGAWIIGKEHKEYSVRVYENEEFVDLCKEVGFKEVKIYSDWQGSPYHEEAEMVIFVAKK
jgi:SAM-dependent methyltransferase